MNSLATCFHVRTLQLHASFHNMRMFVCCTHAQVICPHILARVKGQRAGIIHVLAPFVHASACSHVHFKHMIDVAEPDDNLDLVNASAMCLVVSDIENSTMLSTASAAACATAQDIHDAIMLELIRECHGVELLREGDSFRVAFRRVHTAVHFCVKVHLSYNLSCRFFAMHCSLYFHV